jgi:hypothetical protein
MGDEDTSSVLSAAQSYLLQLLDTNVRKMADDLRPSHLRYSHFTLQSDVRQFTSAQPFSKNPEAMSIFTSASGPGLRMANSPTHLSPTATFRNWLSTVGRWPCVDVDNWHNGLERRQHSPGSLVEDVDELGAGVRTELACWPGAVLGGGSAQHSGTREVGLVLPCMGRGMVVGVQYVCGVR